MAAKMVSELQRGDVVTRFPYGGSEKLPVTVEWVHPARMRNARIVEGVDASGRKVMVPCGHKSNEVEVQ